MKNKVIKNISSSVSSFIHSSELDTDDRFLLEFNSEGALSVKGCREILGYSEDELLMECDSYYINVKGKDLLLSKFSRNETSVCGQLENISFVKR